MRRFHSSQRSRDVSVFKSSWISNPMFRANVCAPAPDQQVVVGHLHHRVGHERRRADTLESCDSVGPLLGAMHAARIELHHSVCVREPTVSNAGIGGIQLQDIHARNQAFENVFTLGNHPERSLDACLGAAVLVAVPVARRDHDRLPRLGGQHRRSRRQACSGRTGLHEFTSAEFLCH